MNIRGAVIKRVSRVYNNGKMYQSREYCCDVIMHELGRQKSGRLIWDLWGPIAINLTVREAEQYIKEEGLVTLKRSRRCKSFLVFRESDLCIS